MRILKIILAVIFFPVTFLVFAIKEEILSVQKCIFTVFLMLIVMLVFALLS